MSKEEAKEAIDQASRIIDQWTDMNLDANDALEMLAPLLQTLITYFDLAPAGKKKSLYEDLEKDLDKENGDPPVFEPESEQEDLFGRKDEEETDND